MACLKKMKMYDEQKEKIEKDLEEIKANLPNVIKKIQEDVSCIKQAVEILLQIKSQEISIGKQIVEALSKKEDSKSS